LKKKLARCQLNVLHNTQRAGICINKSCCRRGAISIKVNFHAWAEYSIIHPHLQQQQTIALSRKNQMKIHKIAFLSCSSRPFLFVVSPSRVNTLGAGELHIGVFFWFGKCIPWLKIKLSRFQRYIESSILAPKTI